MTPELHIMIDLETLSLRSNAVILEVGYAIFETNADGVQSSGSWSLFGQPQMDSGRICDMGTIEFWIEQSSEAQKAVFKRLPKFTVEGFIREFDEQIPWHNIQAVWAKGLHFDIPKLEDLYNKHGRHIPWHYRTPRDLRTLTWLAGMTSADYVKPLLAHSGEADAVAQALTVQLALRVLQERGLT